VKLDPEFQPSFAAGGSGWRARKKEINFELKFCMKFYREVFQSESFSDSGLRLNGKLNENLW